MSFCILAYKAYRIGRKLKRYEHEKENAIRIHDGLTPVYTIADKYHHFWSRCRRNTCYFLRRICMLSPDNRLQQFCTKLRMDGSFENYIAKSILGFFGGILLTYVFFMFFIIQLNFSLTGATLWCMFFGLILTLGLAFSHVVRVIVFLLLPQFFSKRGRQALMAFAFVLALTGPAKNTLRNTEIMFESLACGQEQLKVAVRQIIEAIKKPFMAIKDAFRKVMKIIKLIVKKIKDILLAIKRIIVSILRVIKSVIQWLGNIVNICNKKVGTPFQRCMRVFDGAVTDCQAKLGPLFNWMCSLTYVVSIVCYVVKIFDLICMLLDFINNNVIGVVKKKVKSFVDHIRNIFYVSVDFKHSFHFETQQSISMREIAASLVAEIRQRTEKFLTIFDWMGFAFSLLFLTMIFKVIQYRLKFMKNDRFDNRFITKDFRDIDLQRAKNDLETVIPLNRREKSQYIIAKSFRLAKAEKVQLAKSAVFLGITTFKLCIHMLTDYCLYWLLSLIRQHGSVQTTVEAPNTVGVHIEGEGLMADLLRSVAKAFKPLGIKMEVDTVPCLPDPIPPDYGRYIQIVAVMLLCWLLALLEPYGLRMRHVVMCYYYPDRARQRAVWLYNHILRSRGGFLKFARRQLRRKFGKDKEGAIEKVSLLDRLRERFPFLNIILGKSSQKSCLLCGRVVKKGSKQQLIICPTPNCIGQYCVACFADLKNICPICKKPIEYGDLSDVSIERDSSDDDDDDDDDDKGLQPYDKNRRRSSTLEKRHPDNIETGIVSGDESNRSRASSVLSYSYQYDIDNDVNVGKEALATRPSFRDVEAQSVFEPTSTQIFNQLQPSETEAEENEEKKLTDTENKRKRLIGKKSSRKRKESSKKEKKKKASFPANTSTITTMFMFFSKKQKEEGTDEETQKMLEADTETSISTISSETDTEISDYDLLAANIEPASVSPEHTTKHVITSQPTALLQEKGPSRKLTSSSFLRQFHMQEPLQAKSKMFLRSENMKSMAIGDTPHIMPRMLDGHSIREGKPKTLKTCSFDILMEKETSCPVSRTLSSHYTHRKPEEISEMSIIYGRRDILYPRPDTSVVCKNETELTQRSNQEFVPQSENETHPNLFQENPDANGGCQGLLMKGEEYKRLRSSAEYNPATTSTKITSRNHHSLSSSKIRIRPPLAVKSDNSSSDTEGSTSSLLASSYRRRRQEHVAAFESEETSLLHEYDEDSENETRSEMSSVPLHSRDEMKLDRAKLGKTETTSSASTSQETETGLRAQLKNSLMKMFIRIAKTHKNPPKVLTEYVLNKERREGKTKSTHAPYMHKTQCDPRSKQKEAFRSDLVEVESISSGHNSEQHLEKLKGAQSTFSGFESRYGEVRDDSNEEILSSESSEMQTSERNDKYKLSSVRTTSPNSEISNTEESKSPSGCKYPISSTLPHIRSFKPLQQETFSSIPLQELEKSRKLSSKESNKKNSNKGKYLQHFGEKKSATSSIRRSDLRGMKYNDGAGARFCEQENKSHMGSSEYPTSSDDTTSCSIQTEECSRQSPIPGRPPLYSFDSFAYQGHEAYFNLVNELEDELQHRKRKQSYGKMPPDLIQSDKRQIMPQKDTENRIQPSTSTEMTPDIVPRVHNSVEAVEIQAMTPSSNQQYANYKFQQLNTTGTEGNIPLQKAIQQDKNAKLTSEQNINSPSTSVNVHQIPNNQISRRRIKSRKSSYESGNLHQYNDRVSDDEEQIN